MKKSLALITLTLCANVAQAEPPTTDQRDAAVIALVNEKVVSARERADAKRKKFSRAAPVPVQRRVRVLSPTAETDTRGKEFVRFAIDERPAFPDMEDWHEGRVVGCVYLETRKVFVQQGTDYIPARGRKTTDASPDPHACRSAAHASSQAPKQPTRS